MEGLTFRIARGEVVGFLGPNGAGKTTTLKLLCGLLYPSRGRATVLGHTPFRREHAFLHRIALVMGHKGLLWQDLPAMEMLLAHKEIYDLPEGPSGAPWRSCPDCSRCRTCCTSRCASSPWGSG